MKNRKTVWYIADTDDPSILFMSQKRGKESHWISDNHRNWAKKFRSLKSAVRKAKALGNCIVIQSEVRNG